MSGKNKKGAVLRASMVITYYIKLFRMRADRQNGTLIPLLLLVAETETKITYITKITKLQKLHNINDTKLIDK